MSERQNIEVDYCPKCRGVWLDRGELDKIIEKSTQTPTPEYRSDHRPDYRDDRGRERNYDRDRDYRHGSRRKSWLSEIFD
jgi:Zn-finger nucleic acid-binding protein